MKHRTAFLISSLLLIASSLAWFSGESESVVRLYWPIKPDEAYAIECTSNRCDFDLDFTADERYLMVVSSLGDSDREYRITISAEAITKSKHFPARRIAPLASRKTEWIPGIAIGASHPAAKGIGTSRACETCESQRRGGKNRNSAPRRREFFLHVTDGPLEDAKQYTRVNGVLAGCGERVQVFLDDRQTVQELSSGLVDEIIRFFDEELLERCQRTLGAHCDIDGDGRFTILISPWLGRLQGGRTSLGGFVRSSDFRPGVKTPFGNHCDMLYLNSNLHPGAHLQSLLAHEFAHAVCFSIRAPSERHRYGFPDEEDWLSEAIAHLSENLNGNGWSNLDYRISRFLSKTDEYPLVVSDYYRSGLWRNHGCRGATYLFLRWCVDQFGEEVLPRLVRSPAHGTRNLEWATGLQFEELYRRWTLALLQSGHKSDSAGSPETGLSGTGSSGANRNTAADGFTSLDLRGKLGNWGLAGPRIRACDLDKGPQSKNIRGTATAYYELRVSKHAGSRRIRIAADSGTHLQVTLIKQPHDLPTFEIATSWGEAKSDGTSHSATSSKPILQVHLPAKLNGVAEVEMISCEVNTDEIRKSVCFNGDDLREMTATRETGDKETTGEVFHLPIPFRRKGTQPLLIKVIAITHNGRRIAGWAVSPPLIEPGRRLRLANFEKEPPVQR